MSKKQPLKLSDPEKGTSVDLSIHKASEGLDGINLDDLSKKLGYFTFDPGFVSTASCESKITYIDGDKGELRYRGYPIEQLAEHSHFVETAYLLYYGELPSAEQLDEFNRSLAEHTELNKEAMTSLLNGFSRQGHPMALLMAAISSLAATYYPEKDIYNSAYRDRTFLQLFAKISIVVAWIHCYREGKPLTDPDPAVPYTHNFLNMAFADRSNISNTFIRAVDVILLLHADHEQNASTSTVRLTGSTEASPFAAITSGIASLWGPAHGGANEAVIRMLEEIVSSGQSLEHYIDRAKDKNDHFRLMGFGHRIYKHYDPRAKIIQQICHDLLAELEHDNPNKPLLETASELEKIALEDEYFVARKLYPNVDFYSGIILNAMGIPSEMFTVIFAFARTAGWISHWNEMMSNGHVRIYRPRQIYTGNATRDYISVDRR